MLWGATMGAASAGGAGGAVGAGTGGVIGAVEFAPLVGGSCPPSRLIISGVEVWPPIASCKVTDRSLDLFGFVL